MVIEHRVLTHNRRHSRCIDEIVQQQKRREAFTSVTDFEGVRRMKERVLGK